MGMGYEKICKFFVKTVTKILNYPQGEIDVSFEGETGFFGSVTFSFELMLAQ